MHSCPATFTKEFFDCNNCLRLNFCPSFTWFVSLKTKKQQRTTRDTTQDYCLRRKKLLFFSFFHDLKLSIRQRTQIRNYPRNVNYPPPLSPSRPKYSSHPKAPKQRTRKKTFNTHHAAIFDYCHPKRIKRGARSLQGRASEFWHANVFPILQRNSFSFLDFEKPEAKKPSSKNEKRNKTHHYSNRKELRITFNDLLKKHFRLERTRAKSTKQLTLCVWL